MSSDNSHGGLDKVDRRAGFRAWPRWGRLTTYAVVVLVLLLVAGALAVVTVVRSSFPQTDGEIAVPGLRQEVRVLRDGSGIPQVYADSGHDLFYAQGYVQAQDRFFEMDVRRHTTAGRLSELFGEDTLDIDRTVRTMGWRRVARRELPLLSPSTRAYLRAYSDGVNAYIHSHTPSEMSLEYTLLGLTGVDDPVEDWTPLDSVAWLKAMAWDLRGNMQDEIQRGLLSGTHSAAEISELFPAYPYDRHRPIVEGGGLVDGRFDQDAGAPPRGAARAGFGPAQRRALERVDRALRGMPQALAGPSTGADGGADGEEPDRDGIGSNAWVVDGAHSTTGKPILANDPHLGVSVPGIWYQMGLHCTRVDEDCPFDVSGFTFSGLPGVVIGHNQDVAWGFTNLGPDVTDLFLEKVTGDGYLYAGRERRLRTRVEDIEVLGRSEPVRLTVRSTRHGPLLSDVDDQAATVGASSPAGPGAPDRGSGYAVALAWTALTPGRTADAIFEIDRATDWGQFRAAARDFAVPSQNLVYADTAGHIGYQAPGVIPVRRGGRHGDYPARGWLRADDWTGRSVPFRALPSELDPDDGFVATANQAVTGPDYPYYLGDSWSAGYRSQRIVDLLRAKPRLSVADMSRIQLDTRNGFAPTFVPYLLRTLMPSSYFAAGQRLLQGWDFRQGRDSAAAAYYNAVWRNTLAMTFHDDLPRAAWPTGDGRWFEVVRRLLREPDSHWWDDADTVGVVETRDDILAAAMQEARDELVRRQSRRPSEWTWGHQHRLTLESQTLGQSRIGLVRRLFNRGGYQLGGGTDVVDATKWDASADDYTVTAAPSMRMVVSLGDLDDSRWVNLTGASGHAFDPHYVDQTALWADGRTLAWRSSRSAVAAASSGTLVLRPDGDG